MCWGGGCCRKDFLGWCQWFGGYLRGEVMGTERSSRSSLFWECLFVSLGRGFDTFWKSRPPPFNKGGAGVVCRD